jgi:beta-N-acetylhexosaminidase
MAGLGIDLNFAPVLAVGGGALGDRSYGDEPAVVTDRAGLFVDAMQGAGVLPVLKHFPGLGSVDVNTDEGVAVTPPLDQLRQRDLVPYAELLGREPVGVMVSHVRIPDLTSDTPASLAPATYELLVDEFGFDGLVVTDSLGAGAVASNWSTADAAVLAVQAGADMVVFTDPAQLDPVLDALRTAVADGRIPETRVRDGAEDVLAVQGVDPCTLLGP